MNGRASTVGELTVGLRVSGVDIKVQTIVNKAKKCYFCAAT